MKCFETLFPVCPQLTIPESDVDTFDKGINYPVFFLNVQWGVT